MADAIYCARFVQLLHKLDTPNFSTLQYFNSVLTQVVLGIFCCTEGEAVRLGRLLRETIATLEAWRSNKDVYLRECISKRGMAASFSDTSKRVPFDQFPRLLYKWYLQTTKAFTDCLDSSEYMQVKNALLVLTRINDVYPTLRRSHEDLEKRVNRLRDTEEREDIKVTTTN
jgi:THO complex subunit 2